MYRFIHEKDLNSYEKDNKRLSYKNLFYNDDSLILCNNIANDLGEDLEIVNGEDYDDDTGEWDEVYQYYIIDDDTAKRLMDYTNEIIYYHNRLDIYVLGVTHYGTSWDYMLTDFKLEKAQEDDWYMAIKDEGNDENDNDM